MYTHDRRVTYSEISMKGFADIAQIAEYFQDCSVFQSEVLGMGLTYMNEHHLAWLLASWQIDVDTYPEMGCKVSVSTWPYKFDAAFGYRNFMLQDENGRRLAVANSQWILVDMENGHRRRRLERLAPLARERTFVRLRHIILWKRKRTCRMHHVRLLSGKKRKGWNRSVFQKRLLTRIST